jgi:DNA-binding transcriptional MerR regulator/methylmalonyl-CoA mutase cobalamin-binding subunit
MEPEVIERGLYPISAVSALTGVNAVTLRAWERRYGLIKPARTEAGHRLYTEADVERIKLVLELLDDGVAISRITEDLLQAHKRVDDTDREGDPWTRYRHGMLEAVAGFDEEALEANYNEAMGLYSVEAVTSQLLLPLFKTLGVRWLDDPAGIAEEHFLSAFMRNKLGARFHHRNLQNTGPRIVAATLPGERHEFGLLLFALAAHARGYRIVLLGADMPLGRLPEVVRKTDSDAITLSGSSESVKNDLDDALRALVHAARVPVLIGGTYAQRHHQALRNLGAHPISDDLVVGLHTLGRFLPLP